MKLIFPIHGKTQEELCALNCNGAGGYYPIGSNNCWHGGLHFDGTHAIEAIADGTIVAYRMTKSYLEETTGGKTYKYSSCFMLIRHEYETPKGAKLTFYSHYNHLLPWAEYGATQTKPAAFSKKGFEITANSLNVRSSTDSRSATNKVGTLSKGDKVDAVAVDATWAKMTGEEKFFVHKNMAKITMLDAEPTFDAVTACELAVKVGDIVGYSGRLEDANLPAGRTSTHIEVFSADDVAAFIANPKKDGDKKPTLLKVNAGTALKKMEKKYDTSSFPTFTLSSGTAVKILDKDTDPEWVQVKELKRIRSVKHAWLTFHDNAGASNDYYTVKSAHLTEVSTAFGGMEVTSTTKLSFVKKDGDNRRVSFAIPEASAGTYWVKKAALGGAGEKVPTTSDISGCYEVNPNTPKFESNAGTVGEELIIEIKGLETARDEAKARWLRVKNDSLEGWVKDDDPGVAKVSAFDWPRFIVAKENGDKAADPVIDYSKLSPFFKTIVDQIDANGDCEVSRAEVQAALKDQKLGAKLSRIICLHPSEWWIDSEMKQWQRVFDKIGAQNTTLLKTRIKNLCWWNDVADKVSGFPKEPAVYHWNPLAFVEHMKSMGLSGITFEEMKRIATSATDAHINKYLDGINLAIRENEIDSGLKIAHFLAQVFEESVCLKYTREQGVNDNAYGGFPGRGLIQITTKTNYEAYEKFVGEDVTSSLVNKQKLESEPHAARSAGWFWNHYRKLNDDAEANDFISVTYAINGGFNGYDRRFEWLRKGLDELCPGETIDTNYTLAGSKVNNSRKGAFGWGLWHDPASNKTGCTKNATLALEGYQRFVFLHDAAGAPALTDDWYGKAASTIRSFVEGRITSLGGDK